MEFVCDAQDGKTWFRIETEAEATAESDTMKHAVEKYFRRERDKAHQTYQSSQPASIERDIGLKAHIARTMPVFVTLRDREGTPLATGMLPPRGADDAQFRIIIVGPSNADPYPANEIAIQALGAHYKMSLDRARCFPYAR
jgi:hypothetical protein